MRQDALNGSFQDRVRLVENELVRNGRWCVPTSLVHRLEAEYHDALRLTTSSVEKHWEEINHGVEGEGLYKAVELQSQTCPSAYDFSSCFFPKFKKSAIGDFRGK